MDDELKALEKEADELRQNLWIWKGISFVLLVLYLGELVDGSHRENHRSHGWDELGEYADLLLAFK